MHLLQQQRTRFHEGVRGRPTNPTFTSSNVCFSLGNNAAMSRPYPSYSQYSMIRETKPSSPRQPITSNLSNNNQDYSPLPALGRRNSNSNLSSYGTSSLKNLNRFISDKDVYDKQQKKYNIISVMPKEYEDTIKVYPKYHLEDHDENYYKKMKIENQIANKVSTKKNMFKNAQRQNFENAKNRESNPELISSQNSAIENVKKTNFRAKYLNNVDEVADVL